MAEQQKPEGYLSPEEWYPTLPMMRMSVAALFEHDEARG